MLRTKPNEIQDQRHRELELTIARGVAFVKWETIADRLSAAGWSSGYVSAVDVER